MNNFNYILLLWALIGLSAAVQAQTPKEILGIAKESKSIAYYQEQAGLWEKEVAKDSKNAFAWLQLYRARRSELQLTDMKAWINDNTVVYKKLRPIIDRAKAQVPNSFEYYFMEAANTRTKAKIGFLQKAYAADPDRRETYEGLLIHYVTTGQEAKAKEMAKQMIRKNYYSNANLKWNYNALQTADKNGIFISNGDLDTMPRWVLQLAAGIRTDVVVISKWRMANDLNYRKMIFDKINLEDLPQTSADFDNPELYVNATAAHILKQAKQKVYMGCGTDVNFFKQAGIYDNMYLVGTALVYASSDFNNLATTIENFEEKYDLEYLQNNFQTHHEDDMVRKQMNMTYVPGMMKLKKHFEAIGDHRKTQYYMDLILSIAEASGRKDEVMSWF